MPTADRFRRSRGRCNPRSAAEPLWRTLEDLAPEFAAVDSGMMDAFAASGGADGQGSLNLPRDVEKGCDHGLQDTLEPLEGEDIFFCTACGYTVTQVLPDKCPRCKAAKKVFRRLE
jgi:rubrerythrin